ncbi:hypothetical protein [Mycobacterium talmoniae]|uniref:Uncharacterized protein n=1 Tax=Mycobacterium talmoniae TaxID=1858794 RepID=A0A2S8BF29_9MYCO|nr:MULTISPECIES: hypothetical protein [Mycobacterium]PQM45238.1 hypothetical protein C1Y40_04597 [Mycobacterium talmoniae]TDH50134.1 hypothetical protein E2F47_18895 [Mycobacterium eburneum]
MTQTIGKCPNTDTGWMAGGAARTDSTTPALPPIQPAKRRLHAAWRENAQSRILALDVEVDCLITRLETLTATERRRLVDAKERLRAADAIVKSRPGLRYAWTGVDIARALAHMNAVEVTLTRLSPPSAVAAKLPTIIADAALLLKPHDARVEDLRRYAAKVPLNDGDRDAIAQDMRAVYAACADEHVKTRSFRNILFGATFVLTLFAVGVGLLGWRAPDWVVLCAPTRQMVATCPSGGWAPASGDVFVVELIGLFSASLVGAVAIRRMRGSSTPYAVPMASLLVKLPTGALTAVAGLLLLRAGILGPDVAAAGTAQLVAYALIFGASQQAFTRLIDIQTQNVLDSIPTPNRDAAKDPGSASQRDQDQ